MEALEYCIDVNVRHGFNFRRYRGCSSSKNANRGLSTYDEYQLQWTAVQCQRNIIGIQNDENPKLKLRQSRIQHVTFSVNSTAGKREMLRAYLLHMSEEFHSTRQR